MSEIDLNQQWRELQENYATMVDEELEALAQQAYDLTDLARQVLQAEITRRHLTIKLRLDPPADDDAPTQTGANPPQGYPEGFDPEDWGLVNFTHVDNIEQARELKDCFEAAGIPSYFGSDVVDDLRLLPSPLNGALVVKVREVDLNRARDVRKRCVSETDENAEEEQPADFSVHCPECHSTEVVLEEFAEANEVPGTGPKYKWTCDACGHRWEDAGVEI